MPTQDRRPGLLIDGRLVQAERSYTTSDPATGEVLGEAPDAGVADEKRALAVARRIRTGTYSVNGGNYFFSDAPFGGFMQSGVGREKGVDGLEEFLEGKTYGSVAAQQSRGAR